MRSPITLRMTTVALMIPMTVTLALVDPGSSQSSTSRADVIMTSGDPDAVHTVPASIDATGQTDVSIAMTDFVESVPDGSTIVFPPGSVYLFEIHGIKLAGRHGLDFVGTGSTLLLRTAGIHTDSAAFWLSNLGVQSTTGIRITGFTIQGDNPNTGTTRVYGGREGASGIWTGRGTSEVEIRHVTFRDLYGHCLLLTDDATGNWTDDVLIQDNQLLGCGTMGIALVGASNIVIDGNVINDVGWSVIDIEAERDEQGASDVMIRDNDISRYGWNGTSSNWWLAMVPDDEALNSRIDRVTAEYNRVHVGAATPNNGNADGVGGLAIRSDKSNPKSDIIVRSNWTADDDTRSSRHSVMSFNGVDGLQVLDNIQPIAGGAGLVVCTECTDVRTQSAARQPELVGAAR